MRYNISCGFDVQCDWHRNVLDIVLRLINALYIAQGQLNGGQSAL